MMIRTCLWTATLLIASFAACGSAERSFPDSASSPDAAGATSIAPGAGPTDAGRRDARASRDSEDDEDAGFSQHRDGGARDAGACDDCVEGGALPPPPDAGPYACPTAQFSRAVGTHSSAMPALTWSGAGYTLLIDEQRGTPLFDLYVEKTDASGHLISGPILLGPTNNNGASRFWPSIAFNGWEYGIAFLTDEGTRAPTFARMDLSLNVIPGSVVTLGTSTSGPPNVAWSDVGAWGVTWSEGSTVRFQRFDFAGTPLYR